MTEKGDPWSIRHSAELYRLSQWGEGCFSISPQGEIVANQLFGETRRAISLCAIRDEIRRRGIPLPLVVHFPHLLDHRIRRFQNAFSRSIRFSAYQGRHRACFPVKVNQKRSLVKRILAQGAPHHLGLEVGTKAELVEAISLLADPEAYLICNGYKDADYVRLALMAGQAGLNVRIVLERPYEIPLVIQQARLLGVEPKLGIRVRLSNRSAGRWAASSGDEGMFGFRLPELVAGIEELDQAGCLHWLRLLHFHQGSQIPDLGVVERGLTEACQHYRHLVREGAPLEAIDVGGGLAIDYEGSQSESSGSRNYSVEAYSDTVVGVIHQHLSALGAPPPDIITESGRAIASHCTVLLFEVLDHEALKEGPPRGSSASVASFPTLEELRDLKGLISKESPEALRDRLDSLSEEAGCAYTHSQIDLRQYSQFLREKDGIRKEIDQETPATATPSVPHRNQTAGEHYYGNFSMFQSLPDAWAIGQPFPIVPINRLDEKPNRKAVIADITCDCDGAIGKYFTGDSCTDAIPLHEIRPGESYCLAAFLVGSYQESLGDIHNLFGAPAAVSVRFEQGELAIETIDESQSIASVLNQVGFSPSNLFDGFTDLADDALAIGRITSRQHGEMIRFFGSMLDSSTYLQPRTETRFVPHESDQRIYRSSLPAL